MYPSVKSVNVEEKVPGSQHFKWGEFLWLPKWQVYCQPTQQQAVELIGIARTLDLVRSVLGGKSVIITSGLRPFNYNQWPPPYGVAGAKLSSHCYGMAVDFTLKHMTADQARETLRPELERMKIRLEDLPGSDWVHIDRKDPGGSGRFFKP